MATVERSACRGARELRRRALRPAQDQRPLRADRRTARGLPTPGGAGIGRAMASRGSHLINADRGFATGGGAARAARRAAVRAARRPARPAPADGRDRRHAARRLAAPRRLPRPGPGRGRPPPQLAGAGAAGDLGLGRLVQGVGEGRMDARPTRCRCSNCSRQCASASATPPAPRDRRGGSTRSPTACATMPRARPATTSPRITTSAMISTRRGSTRR